MFQDHYTSWPGCHKRQHAGTNIFSISFTTWVQALASSACKKEAAQGKKTQKALIGHQCCVVDMCEQHYSTDSGQTLPACRQLLYAAT
jgi:hypothetical protein